MDDRLASDIVDQAEQKGEALGLSAVLANEVNKDLLKKAVPLGKFAGGFGLALSAVDATNAAINADKLYGLHPTTKERLAAAAGSAANSASFGVVPADKAAFGLVPRRYMTEEEFENLKLHYVPQIQK